MTRSFSVSAFTLIEMLISLSILSMLAAIGFGSGIDSYERQIAHSDHTSAFWAVLKARGDAMNGLCNGDSCTASMAQTVSLDATHIAIFEELSGMVGNPQSVVLGNGSTTDILSINSEGQISVTH